MTATHAEAETRRRGWCPGALRPMQSGDGLLVRIKPSCGVLSLDQAIAVARLTAQHGNGIIELTSRANLQLRGVRDEALTPLTDELDRLGLLDASPETEAIRNVISSPLAGVDPTAYDTRPIVQALETALTSTSDLHALSDKFGFLIDGGGRLSLSDVEADIRFNRLGAGFAVGLARDDGTAWIGTVAPHQVADIAVALARAFLAAAEGARRMRALSEDVRWALGNGSVEPIAGNTADMIDAAWLHSRVGVMGFGNGEPSVALVGLPFGATTAAVLEKVFTGARQLGVQEVRLAPWRALALPTIDEAAARDLVSLADDLGFVTEPADPRRSIAACPGAPACANGSTPVREDADQFARAVPALPREVTLHVSGCPKGCACRKPAGITLVGEEGRYGLVVNGTAAEPPRHRLSSDQVTEMLAQLASAMTKAGDTPDARAKALAAALKEIAAA